MPKEIKIPDEILDKLPEEQRVELQAIFLRQRFFRGPLPPPDAFESYEQTLPGAADRILKMAEK